MPSILTTMPSLPTGRMEDHNTMTSTAFFNCFQCELYRQNRYKRDGNICSFCIKGTDILYQSKWCVMGMHDVRRSDFIDRHHNEYQFCQACLAYGAQQQQAPSSSIHRIIDPTRYAHLFCINRAPPLSVDSATCSWIREVDCCM